LPKDEKRIVVLQLELGHDVDFKVVGRISVQNDQLESWLVRTFHQK
jgi:hypothetical protein